MKPLFALVRGVVCALTVGFATETRSETDVRTVKSNETTILYTFTESGADCKAVGNVPSVVVLSQPKNGKLEVIRRASIALDTAPACSGKAFPGMEVSYTARAGFEGLDQIELSVTFSDGFTARRVIQLTVLE